MSRPYKAQVFQDIQPPDYEKRMAYRNWFNQTMNNNLLDLTFFSDEAWFHLSGYINSQNMRMWCSKNPHYFEEPHYIIKNWSTVCHFMETFNWTYFL
ncbi:hypothetical protein BDFB_014971 [Asbolus verrucosus]|uniref:DDE 3 domain containing protein n=1 Tax=Asbolus verrucosus TaxID=1661398 RepID=A0A482V946_ASBVE|nr:hypothetical protein BDFB_014971 [Asbolus verrucosus]